MGSYPRVSAHGDATYELYGPVSRFSNTSYNHAQVAFLACLKVRHPHLTESQSCSQFTFAC